MSIVQVPTKIYLKVLFLLKLLKRFQMSPFHNDVLNPKTTIVVPHLLLRLQKKNRMGYSGTNKWNYQRENIFFSQQ
jgi:hypothetical protein